MSSWFRRLDLTPVFPEPVSKRRYIFRHGRPRRWPLGAGASLAMAGRLAAAALTRSTTAREDETIAAWGDRVLGASAREWLLEPAMQGIYASPARELSARAIFDGRKRGPRRLAAPAGGMGQFTSRLHERLCRSRRSLFVQHRDRSARSGDRHGDRDAGDVGRSVARAARSRSGRRAFRRSASRRWSRSRCFSLLTSMMCADSACCFLAPAECARSARCSTPTSSRAAARCDPRRGLSAIAMWA